MDLRVGMVLSYGMGYNYGLGDTRLSPSLYMNYGTPNKVRSSAITVLALPSWSRLWQRLLTTVGYFC